MPHAELAVKQEFTGCAAALPAAGAEGRTIGSGQEMLLVPKAPAAVPFPRPTLSVAGTVGVRFGLEVLCWLIAIFAAVAGYEIALCLGRLVLAVLFEIAGRRCCSCVRRPRQSLFPDPHSV